MIRTVLIYGDAVLKQPAAEMSKDFAGLPELIQDMFDTMLHHKGIGLAAPQIGENHQLFIVAPSKQIDPFFQQNDRWPGRVFINPVILDQGGLFKSMPEGCLSIPGLEVSVKRPTHIRMQYLDHLFQPHEESFSGVLARVIQHEYDHLQGILMTDRINGFRQRSVQGHLRRLEKTETHHSK